MNTFIIPSWYPSRDEPYTGIFFLEQAQAMAHVFPDSNFAISTWGTHNHDLLLEAKDHIKNAAKLFKFFFKKAAVSKLNKNLIEYYTPALTWSRAILNGNISTIINVNRKHFLDFQLKYGKVDIIHAHSAYPAGWAAMALAEEFNLPFIITEHMAPFPFPSFLTRDNKISPYLLKPFHKAAFNVVVSPQQETTMSKWGIPKMKVIPNLTNEDFFVPRAKGNPSENFVFVSLAILEERKGIKYLLHAFQKLLQKYPNCLLKIGGDGPQRDEYKILARKLDIKDEVSWLGRLNRNEVVYELQNCDAFVLPSLHENLPLSLIEAIACGKPLISTYSGGSESIINKSNGLIVKPADVEALHQAMEDMVLNHDKYDADKIRADFFKRYSRQAVCVQIMDLYKGSI
ncbi:glycosyltransferase [Pontibacter roseus]|uniref:glycosyltransferase n=1 Tax=Pontibacter roseus TaxID=336989 RepID=UPI00037C8EA9|nr:glycosyltransferase [Pontibacter roseus]